MDLLSVVLGALSLLAVLKGHKSPVEKVKILRELMGMLDFVYLLLSRAKDIHDSYQKALELVIEPLKDGIDDDSQKSRNKALSRAIKNLDRLFPVRSALPTVGSGPVPGEIREPALREAINNIIAVAPEVERGLERFHKTRLSLTRFRDVKNLGDELRNCVTTLESDARAILSYADLVILNVVPVLNSFHSGLRQSLEEL